MADPIQLIQSGRTQLAEISGLPRPNLDFGQRRPEIEFQAAAEASSALSRTISTLSNSLFGQAEKFAEAAGEEFVLNNPASKKQLEAMSQGNSGKFRREFTLNAYSAAIQKYRANELASHASVELINKTGDLQRRIELGKNPDGTAFTQTTQDIVSELTALTQGWASGLAQVSPDAAYQYRATAATHANRVLLASAQRDAKINDTKNKLKIVDDIRSYETTVANILSGTAPAWNQEEQRYLTINEQIDNERRALVSRALGLGSAESGNFAMEEAQKIEETVKFAVLENAVASRREDIGGDLVAINQKILANDLPPDLQKVWGSLSLSQQKKARDNIEKQFQNLIDYKAKSREIRKSDMAATANNLKLAYVDTTDDKERAGIVQKLKDISREFPEIIDAKGIVDLPKMLKEDAQDNYENVAILEDKLRQKDPTLKTSKDILAWAKDNEVSAKTALSLSNKFLPKESGEGDYLLRTQEVEYYIRKKIPDPKTGKVINSPQTAKMSYEIRGLTLSDAPENLGTLLTSKPEVDDDPIVQDLIASIDDGVVTSLAQIRSSVKGRTVSSDTVNMLIKRVGERKLRLIERSNNIGKDIADLSGAQSPATKALKKLDAAADVQSQHQKMIKEWEAGGSKGPAPSIDDAGRIVTERAKQSRTLKQIESTRDSIRGEFGMGGSMLPKSVKEKNIDLSAVQPRFEPGEPVRVTPNYRRALEAELQKGGASRNEIEQIVNQVIQRQIFIEGLQRKRNAQ